MNEPLKNAMDRAAAAEAQSVESETNYFMAAAANLVTARMAWHKRLLWTPADIQTLRTITEAVFDLGPVKAGDAQPNVIAADDAQTTGKAAAMSAAVAGVAASEAA